MKRWILVVLIVSVGVTLAACGTDRAAEAVTEAYAPEASSGDEAASEEDSWDAASSEYERRGVPKRPEDYFPREGESVIYGETICYAEPPYAESRSFGGQQARLLAERAIPEMPDYSGFHAYADYNADGSFFELGVHWDFYDPDLEHGPYRQLDLTVWPEEPTPEQKKRIDGCPQFDPGDTRQTNVCGVTVCASGTPDSRGRTMCFTLSDGSYCYLSGIRDTTCADLTTVMEWLIEHGVQYEAFAMEKGDM